MTTSIQSAAPISAGYKWSLRIKASTLAFPSGVAIVGHIRRKVGDGDVLATLSTANGKVVRVDDNNIDIFVDGDTSKDWEAGTVVMDFVRTDVDPDAYLGFVLKVPVSIPVTRGLV